MEIIKRNYGIIFLSLLFLFTRLYNLLLLPIFTDESIYIYWAKTIITTHSQWFISLSDGKPPLLIWLISIFLSFLPSNLYLFAGRLPSVLSGLSALFAIYFVSSSLFGSKKIALLSSFLYVICPFFVLYDRMALFDSFLNSTLLWSVYFSIRTAKSLSFKDAVLWGGFLGLAFLFKPTAIVFLVLSPVVFLLLLSYAEQIKNWKKILLLLCFVFLVSEGMYSILRFSHTYPAMVLKNQQFQQPIAELISKPFKLTIDNGKGIYSWVVAYYTLPVFMLGVLAFIVLCVKKTKIGLFLFSLWFFPLFVFATVAREIFPRYILFTTPYFLIMCAYLLEYIFGKSKVLKLIVFILIIFPSIQFDRLLLINPIEAPLPIIDYNQYVSQHPSGYGVDKVFTYIRNKSKDRKITLVTQGTFGLYPYAFYLEFWGNPNVRILPKWPMDKIDDEIVKAKKEGPVFILFKEHMVIPNNLPVSLVLKSEKPGKRYPLLLTIIQ